MTAIDSTREDDPQIPKTSGSSLSLEARDSFKPSSEINGETPLFLNGSNTGMKTNFRFFFV